MAGYRDPFLKLFGRTANALPVKLLVAASARKLLLPVYHLISDAGVPHIHHLYDVKGTAAFKRDLDFLLKNFHPLDYHALKRVALGAEKPSKPSFFLTFDDGLSQFYHIVAPILKEKGITAINFLNSDFVDNRDLFFRYKASLLIDKAREGKHATALSGWMKTHFPRQNDYVTALLSVKFDQRHLLDELALMLEVDFRSFLDAYRPYLSSAQVLELEAQGFYFGAHSVNHPEYRFIPLDDQLRQTRESAIWVSEKFTTPDRIFAFPFTDYAVSQAFFDEVYKKNDPVLDFSFGSAGLKDEVFPRHLHRVPFEMGDKEAREIVNTEMLYYLFKKPLGKNTIYRK